MKGKLGRLLGVFEVSFHVLILPWRFIIHVHNKVQLQEDEMHKLATFFYIGDFC